MVHKFSITKLTGKITKGGGLVAAVAAAAIVGGTSTALVMAAIPDSNGTIHGCYSRSAGLLNPKGNLRVIDTDNDETCTGQETSLNWSASGSGSAPTVYDANGQALGTTLGSAASDSAAPIDIYNPTLKRVVTIESGSQGIPGRVFEDSDSVLFQSADCSGQGYLLSQEADITPGVKTFLFVLLRDNPATTYVVVSDDAQLTSITYNSTLNSNGGGVSGPERCNANDPTTDQAYPLTTVTLPFNTPLATPLHF